MTSGSRVAERIVTPGSGRSYKRASMPPTLTEVLSSASTVCFSSPLSGAAAAGTPILPFFDYQRGLADLVTRRSRYVPD
jgi:hypothetical protein